MDAKDKLIRARNVALRIARERPQDVWPQIYLEWFNSALQKIEDGIPVPAFTLAAAQGILLDEEEKK